MADKMPGKEVPFNIVGGSPLLIRAEARGKVYLLRAALGVLQVNDTGEDGDDGVPRLMINAGLNVKIEEYEEQKR